MEKNDLIAITPFNFVSDITPVGSTFSPVITTKVPVNMWITGIGVVTNNSGTLFYLNAGLYSYGSVYNPLSLVTEISITYRPPYLLYLSANQTITLYAMSSTADTIVQLLLTGFED